MTVFWLALDKLVLASYVRWLTIYKGDLTSNSTLREATHFTFSQDDHQGLSGYLFVGLVHLINDYSFLIGHPLCMTVVNPHHHQVTGKNTIMLVSIWLSQLCLMSHTRSPFPLVPLPSYFSNNILIKLLSLSYTNNYNSNKIGDIIKYNEWCKNNWW